VRGRQAARLIQVVVISRLELQLMPRSNQAAIVLSAKSSPSISLVASTKMTPAVPQFVQHLGRR
jgi:hypothetical protein